MIQDTRDFALIHEIATHPEVWPYICDGHEVDPDSFEWPRDWTYLLENDPDPVGFWAFQPEIGALRIHAHFLPEYRGRKAAESARRAFNWIFENTLQEKIVARIPESSKRASVIARWSGMRFIEHRDGRDHFEVTPWVQ